MSIEQSDFRVSSLAGEPSAAASPPAAPDLTQCRLTIQALSSAYMASALLHDIKAPLNNMKLTLALCDASLERASESAMSADLRSRLERYFRVAAEETTRLATLIEAFRPLSAVSEMPVSACMLDALAKDLARLVHHEATVRRVRFDVLAEADRLCVEAERNALLFALLSLVIQLVERTDPGGEVRIVLAKGRSRDALVTLDSTTREAGDGARRALEGRSPDTPLLQAGVAAARACIEALHGHVEACAVDGRSGLRVSLPLAGSDSI